MPATSHTSATVQRVGLEETEHLNWFDYRNHTHSVVFFFLAARSARPALPPRFVTREGCRSDSQYLTARLTFDNHPNSRKRLPSPVSRPARRRRLAPNPDRHRPAPSSCCCRTIRPRLSYTQNFLRRTRTIAYHRHLLQKCRRKPRRRAASPPSTRSSPASTPSTCTRGYVQFDEVHGWL